MDHISPRTIFMFPWLAYGHISPFFELAKKLSERGFYVYLCSTPINLKSIQKQITKNSSPSIQIVEIHLPSLPELPPQHHTTNGLPLHLIATLKQALKMAKPRVLNILKTLNPDLIIHDALIRWIQALAYELNIPAVQFLTSSAATCSYFTHVAQRPGIDFPFPDFRLRKFEKENIFKLMGSRKAQRDPTDEIPEGLSTTRISFIKTSREIEGKYIDYFSDLTNTKIVAVGNLVQAPDYDQDEANELIDWLGKKNEYSTLFISFGSEYYLKKEEIDEIAIALELSKVNFIWVIRFPIGEFIRIDEALSKDFLEITRERGKIVHGWAPQSRILSHASIGGFVSHCGWNSCLESLEFGVPLIAMPMHLDQPLNAKLVVEVGIGAEVVRDDNGKLQRGEIAKVLKDVIFGNLGKKLRGQVRDLRQKVKMREKDEMDEACRQLLAQISLNSEGKIDS